jgi:hypothetical protein
MTRPLPFSFSRVNGYFTDGWCDSGTCEVLRFKRRPQCASRVLPGGLGGQLPTDRRGVRWVGGVGWGGGGGHHAWSIAHGGRVRG